MDARLGSRANLFRGYRRQEGDVSGTLQLGEGLVDLSHIPERSDQNGQVTERRGEWFQAGGEAVVGEMLPHKVFAFGHGGGILPPRARWGT